MNADLTRIWWSPKADRVRWGYSVSAGKRSCVAGMLVAGPHNVDCSGLGAASAHILRTSSLR